MPAGCNLPALKLFSTLLDKHFRFAQLLYVRQCLIKQACHPLLSLDKHFRFAQLLYVRQCLIKQAYHSLLSLDKHFLTVNDVYAGLGYFLYLAAL